MVFNSISFLIFFPIVYLIYWIIPKKFKWILLLIASYFFYMSWNPALIFLIVFTTLVSYGCGLLIAKSHNEKWRKALLIMTIFICLGVLFFFKYFNFLAQSIVSLLNLTGLKIHSFALDLLLPVGISFYTFQTLSYVIDVYRNKIPAEKHLGYYALFVSFFPQLVAGPIERPENLLPQLKNPRPFSTKDNIEGLRMALIGFVKKVAIADVLAIYVNSVYNNVIPQTGLAIMIATMLFAVQIYCDFSGYTDIAIGISKMIGYDLMQNFNHPYKATSIKDFWNRWHISLSSWFRDYLYIPLGGSRCKKSRHLTNLFIVFLVSGLWHGASWTFIIWGALHGLYQIIGILTKKTRANMYKRCHIDETSRKAVWFKRFITFGLVCVAWVFFRANNFTDLLRLFKRLLLSWDFSSAYFQDTFAGLGMNLAAFLHVLTTIALLVFVSRIGEVPVASEKGFTLNKKIIYVGLALIVVFTWTMSISAGTAGDFIYFQF